MKLTPYMKGVAAVVAIVTLLTLFHQQPVVAQATYRQVGARERIMATNTYLTNIYVTSRKVDLEAYNSVFIHATCFGQNTTISNTMRFQWSPDASNWFTEFVLNPQVALSTAQDYVPLERRISLVSTNMTYNERFNRIMRFFRVQVNGNQASPTNFINVEAYPLND